MSHESVIVIGEDGLPTVDSVHMGKKVAMKQHGYGGRRVGTVVGTFEPGSFNGNDKLLYRLQFESGDVNNESPGTPDVDISTGSENNVMIVDERTMLKHHKLYLRSLIKWQELLLACS